MYINKQMYIYIYKKKKSHLVIAACACYIFLAVVFVRSIYYQHKLIKMCAKSK